MNFKVRLKSQGTYMSLSYLRADLLSLTTSRSLLNIEVIGQTVKVIYLIFDSITELARSPNWGIALTGFGVVT